MKKNKYIIAIVITLIFITSSFVEDKDKITKIKVETTMPNVWVSAKKDFIFSEKKTFSIYYLGKYRVYEFPAYSIDNKGKISNSINNGYFIHEYGEKYGKLYPIYDTQGSKQLVDSVLRLRAFQGNDIFFEHVDTTFIGKKLLPNGIVKEISVPKLIKDRTYPDTVYHYYSDKLVDIEYSFSKKIDHIKQSKFFKCKGVFNSQQYQGDTIKLPRREFLVEMRKDIVTDQDKESVFGVLDKYLKNPK